MRWTCAQVLWQRRMGSRACHRTTLCDLPWMTEEVKSRRRRRRRVVLSTIKRRIQWKGKKLEREKRRTRTGEGRNCRSTYHNGRFAFVVSFTHRLHRILAGQSQRKIRKGTPWRRRRRVQESDDSKREEVRESKRRSQDKRASFKSNHPNAPSPSSPEKKRGMKKDPPRQTLSKLLIVLSWFPRAYTTRIRYVSIYNIRINIAHPPNILQSGYKVQGYGHTRPSAFFFQTQRFTNVIIQLLDFSSTLSVSVTGLCLLLWCWTSKRKLLEPILSSIPLFSVYRPLCMYVHRPWLLLWSLAHYTHSFTSPIVSSFPNTSLCCSWSFILRLVFRQSLRVLAVRRPLWLRHFLSLLFLRHFARCFSF